MSQGSSSSSGSSSGSSSSSSSSSSENLPNPEPSDSAIEPQYSPPTWSPQIPYPGIPVSPYPVQPGQYPPYPPYPPYYPPYTGQNAPYPPAGYPYVPPNAAMPPYMLPPVYPPPRRGSLKPLWITIGVASVLMVALCIGCSLLFSLSLANLSSQTNEPSQSQVPTALDPVIAAQDFCAYEINQDYPDAYQQLSANLQSQVSEQQFESDNQARDAALGPVIGCSAAQGSTNSADQGSASSPTTLSLYIWLGGATTIDTPPVGSSGSITMVQQGSGWKVDALDQALRLT